MINIEHDYKEIAFKVIDWFSDYFDVHPEVDVNIVSYGDIRCWGQTDEHEWEIGTYVIDVAKDQPLRDYIATLMHEMIHVKQWVTGRWRGDGEKEAERLQYKLTDRFWREGEI